MATSPETPKKSNPPSLDHPTLPATGYIRIASLLVFVPFSSATIWRKVKKNQFPSPVKLSDRVTAWRCEDIRAWIERMGI
jgi:predicted DNA-binding transcriptional regulator AlpA